MQPLNYTLETPNSAAANQYLARVDRPLDIHTNPTRALELSGCYLGRGTTAEEARADLWRRIDIGSPHALVDGMADHPVSIDGVGLWKVLASRLVLPVVDFLGDPLVLTAADNGNTAVSQERNGKLELIEILTPEELLAIVINGWIGSEGLYIHW